MTDQKVDDTCWVFREGQHGDACVTCGVNYPIHPARCDRCGRTAPEGGLRPYTYDQTIMVCAHAFSCMKEGADERRKTSGVLDSIEDLIERSSLGTPEAKALREQADPAAVERVMERVRELRREQPEWPEGCRCVINNGQRLANGCPHHEQARRGSASPENVEQPS